MFCKYHGTVSAVKKDLLLITRAAAFVTALEATQQFTHTTREVGITLDDMLVSSKQMLITRSCFVMQVRFQS